MGVLWLGKGFRFGMAETQRHDLVDTMLAVVVKLVGRWSTMLAGCSLFVTSAGAHDPAVTSQGSPGEGNRFSLCDSSRSESLSSS